MPTTRPPIRRPTPTTRPPTRLAVRTTRLHIRLTRATTRPSPRVAMAAAHTEDRWTWSQRLCLAFASPCPSSGLLGWRKGRAGCNLPIGVIGQAMQSAAGCLKVFVCGWTAASSNLSLVRILPGQLLLQLETLWQQTVQDLKVPSWLVLGLLDLSCVSQTDCFTGQRLRRHLCATMPSYLVNLCPVAGQL